MKRAFPLLIAVAFVCAPLAAGEALFRNASTGYGGGSVIDMKTADINHDGKPDVILLQEFGATNVCSLITLIGNGDGSFRAPVKNPITALARAIAVGDLDGDGTVDLVLDGDYTLLETYRGNSDGSFTLRSSQATANISTGSSLTLTDLNGDGKLDVVAKSQSGLVTFRGKGDGTFADGITQNGTSTTGAIGDFNGDGFTDVLGSAILLATGRGDGSFNPPTTIPGLSAIPITGDFNGDGKLDFIGLRAHTALVHLGHGNGTFTDGARYTVGYSFAGTAADLDRDGKLDIVIAGNDLVTVMRGNGDGTFAVQAYVANAFFPLAVADFDGDHHPDVLVTPTPTLLLLHGNGDGTLAAYRKDFVAPAPNTESFPLNSPSGLAAGDFDGNGRPDALTWLDGALIVMPNDGKGGFGAPMTLALPAGISSVSSNFAVGDVNGDGKTDIVAAGSKLWTYLGNSNGTFTAAVPVAVAAVQTIILADLNGDGHLDAVAGISGPTGLLLPGNGDGTFAAPITLPASPEFIADFNGDGRLDFVGTTYSGVYGVYLNNGGGAFTLKETVSNDTNGARAAADFNGDGKADIIDAPVSGSFRVRLGKGDGTFTNLPGFRLGRDGFFSVADFDGDGKLDLAFSNNVILGNGDGTFRTIVSAVASRDWSGPVAAHVDGNGSMDLLLLDPQNWAVNTLLTRTAAAGTTPFPMALTTSLIFLHPGESVTVTATPTTSSTFVPSASVALTVDGTFVGLASWSNGMASLKWTPLSPGDYTIVASFIGDDVFSSSAATISRTAVKVDSVVDLSVSPSPWQVQQLTSILAFVGARQVSTTLPTGTMTIRDDKTVIFSGPYLATRTGIDSYRFTTVGTHIISAEYSGDANYTPATTTYAHIVTKGLAVGVSLNADRVSPLEAGQSLTLTLRIGGFTSADGGTVTFRDFGAELGTVPVSVFAASITIQPQAGYHSYSATYNGNALIDPATSNKLDYVVNTAPCAPSANCRRKHAAH